MRRIAIPLLIVPVLLMAACSTISHEEEATAAGAVMGVLVGSLFGDGAGKATAATVGGIVGGLAGNAYGRDLDAADRRRAERAAFTAEEIGNAEPDRTVHGVCRLDGEGRPATSRPCSASRRPEGD